MYNSGFGGFFGGPIQSLGPLPMHSGKTFSYDFYFSLICKF